jgi:hypothetical protein
MAGEAGPVGRRAVGAPIVEGRDLDVDMALTAVDVPVFDPEVGKMDLILEVREVVLARPFFNLPLVAIRVPVVVVSVAIPFVEPLLVLPLQFVIEHHPIDVDVALGQALALAEVGAKHLGIMFELPFAFEAGVELLAMAVIAVAVAFQQVPAAVGEDDGSVVAVE